MRRNTYILVTVILFSNLIWGYAYFNNYIYCQYQKGRLKGKNQYIEQLLAIIPVISTGKASRQDVSKAAKLGNRLNIGIENDSIVQIGGLTIRFSETEKFVEIVR